MRTLAWEEFLRADAGSRASAATIGVFDGLHLGHGELIGKIKGRGDLQPVVVTFTDNPKRILHSQAFPGDILTLSQRLSILEASGVELTVLIDFSGDFGKLPGREFLSLLSNGCDLRFLAVGYDFRCGYRLDTGADEIRDFCDARGVELELLRATRFDGHPVSSSRIRRAIAEGRLQEARELMGRPYEPDIKDAAILEDGRIRPKAGQVAPPAGVYEVLVGRSGSIAAAIAALRDGAWDLGGLDPRGMDSLRVLASVSRE